MRKILLPVLFSVLLLMSYSPTVHASDVTVSGSAYFISSLLSSYMQKHGYVFIEESAKKNVFAAGDADITIKNEKDIILGTGTTDKKGDFLISVPEEKSYKIIVIFHGRESEYVVSSSEANNFKAYLGYFSSNEVDGWLDAKLK
jgi:hypothetical protein